MYPSGFFPVWTTTLPIMYSPKSFPTTAKRGGEFCRLLSVLRRISPLVAVDCSKNEANRIRIVVLIAVDFAVLRIVCQVVRKLFSMIFWRVAAFHLRDEILFGEPGKKHFGQAQVLTFWSGLKGVDVSVDKDGVGFEAVAKMAVGVGGATVVYIVEFFH